MSLIGDAQEFLYYQKPQGKGSPQLPPRGGVRNVSASYVTGREMPSRPEQDVSQQYTTLKEAREGERAAGILNAPALTEPVSGQVQEPSELESAKGYLGMGSTALGTGSAVLDLADMPVASEAFGVGSTVLGGAAGALGVGTSAYKILSGEGTPEDYKGVGSTVAGMGKTIYDVAQIGADIPAIGGFSGSAGAASTAAPQTAGNALSGVVGSIGNVAAYNAYREIAGAAFGMGAKTMQKQGDPATRQAGEQMETWLAKPISENASLSGAAQHITRNFADTLTGKNSGLSKVLRENEYIRSTGRAIGYLTNPAAGIVDLFKGDQRKAIKNELKKIQRDPGSRVAAAVLSGGLSEIFCFAEGTPITMADGTTKPVEEIDLFDVCQVGGMVNGKGVVIAEDIYDYEGVMVTGSHAVYEDDKWIRVKDSEKSIPVDLDEPIKVYIVNNVDHVLIVNEIIFADYGEVTDSENMTADERLAYLNDYCSI